MHFTDSLSKLIVVNLPSTPQNPAPIWDSKNGMFSPESCARQLLIGTKEDLHHIPEEIKTRAAKSESLDPELLVNSTHTLIKYSKEAYSYLLKMVCGLNSKKQGEPHILGQVKNAWTNFSHACNWRAKKINIIMQAIFEDANKIRTHILDQLKPIDFSVAAKDKAEIKGGEKVLVIAGAERATTGMVRALGKECNTTVGHITISHKDQSELTNRIKELAVETSKKRIKAPIETIDFATLIQQGFGSYDHVFVCLPMNKDSEFDRTIIDLWNRRTRTDGKLVHRQGQIGSDGESSELWKEAQLKNFFGPEDIKAHYTVLTNNQNKIIKHADRAASLCAEARSNNTKAKVAELLALVS